MQKLYEITIPGLSMTADFPAVHHRLLADFPDVVDVLAMTTPATVLVVYTGEHEVDGWIDALSDSVATRRMRLRDRHVDGTETTSSAASPHTHRRQVDAVREAMWRSSRVNALVRRAGNAALPAPITRDSAAPSASLTGAISPSERCVSQRSSPSGSAETLRRSS